MKQRRGGGGGPAQIFGYDAATQIIQIQGLGEVHAAFRVVSVTNKKKSKVPGNCTNASATSPRIRFMAPKLPLMHVIVWVKNDSRGYLVELQPNEHGKRIWRKLSAISRLLPPSSFGQQCERVPCNQTAIATETEERRVDVYNKGIQYLQQHYGYTPMQEFVAGNKHAAWGTCQGINVVPRVVHLLKGYRRSQIQFSSRRDDAVMVTHALVLVVDASPSYVHDRHEAYLFELDTAIPVKGRTVYMNLGSCEPLVPDA